ncbi:hypothetical protein C7122_02630 [Lachnospiraceae bacterium oral taxon 096]|nr:hypothetical protein C7122_02630 [Lachnospiraceae bacterium oral taxon 096]
MLLLTSKFSTKERYDPFLHWQQNSRILSGELLAHIISSKRANGSMILENAAKRDLWNSYFWRT